MRTNLLKRFAAILALAVLPFVTSCSNDDNNASTQNNLTIAEIASSNGDLTILVEALKKADLVSVLNASGEYTVFAPSNQSFQKFLSDNGFTSLNEVPVGVLKDVLLNHVINKKLEAADLQTGYVSTLAKGSAATTNNISMYVDTTNGVVLNGGAENNGATVTTANIKASNGVIHLVDHVIGLPTIVNHAVANPNFSILVSALTRNDQPDFAGILSGTEGSPFTVFAPINTAFVNLLGELNLPGLADVPQEVLENTLKYHVVAGANVLSTNLTNAQSVQTFQGDSFIVNINNSVTITDTADRTANIIAVDVQASNGVIHAIDKVILPNL